MPKIINESEYLKRDDVKAVIQQFELLEVLKYSEIRKNLGLKKRELRPYNTRPVKYEVELVRILKRLMKFDFLFKSKMGNNSYYRINPSKLKEIKSRPTKSFENIKKDKKGIEKELIEIREQSMALILENTRLKERLSQYEDAWAVR